MRTLEFPRSYTVFDLEASGLGNAAVIQQASCILMQDGVCVREFSGIFNYGHRINIDPGALAVHGITNERMAAEGIPAREAMSTLHGMLREAVTFGMPITGVNILRFDLRMFMAAANYFGLDTWDWSTVALLDPALLYKAYKTGTTRKDEEDLAFFTRLGNMAAKGVKWGLDVVAQECNVAGRETSAHDALEDVRLTASVVEAMRQYDQFCRILRGV